MASTKVRHTYLFSSNTGKYGPEKTPYLDNFHAVDVVVFCDKAAEKVSSEISITEYELNKKIHNEERKASQGS